VTGVQTCSLPIYKFSLFWITKWVISLTARFKLRKNGVIARLIANVRYTYY
jgi:hypothetical protein